MDIPVWRTDFEEIDSTNSLCLNRLADDFDQRLPWLVVAKSQTAGRGRGSNQWWASSGALTFSLAIDVTDFQLTKERLGLLSLSTGVSIYESLEQSTEGLRLSVKWPNDIYLKDRKLAGILIEGVPQRDGILVVGVGINTHNTLRDAPSDVQVRAVSLIDAVQDVSSNDVLVNDIAQTMLRGYLSLGEDLMFGLTSLRERWESRSMLDRRDVVVTSGPLEHRGVCLGIDDLGGLVLQTSSSRKTLYGGTVRLVENGGGSSG